MSGPGFVDAQIGCAVSTRPVAVTFFQFLFKNGCIDEDNRVGSNNIFRLHFSVLFPDFEAVLIEIPCFPYSGKQFLNS